MIKRVEDLINNNVILKMKRASRPKGKAGSKFDYVYKENITSFDIETTALEDVEQSIMYIWQWDFEGWGTIVGRTWKEFSILCNHIISSLKNDERLVVYVHWLSHEFQYLKGIYDFKDADLFIIGTRDIARAVIGGKIEFRCSYLLSNQGLDGFLRDMNVPIQKKVGKLDYSVRRFWYTEMSDDELDYCVSDVAGLTLGIREMMNRENDSLYTIPMTSTGYIRREIKKAMHDYSRFHRELYDISADLFDLAMKAFRGGDTHASRFYSGVLIEMNNGLEMKHDDISSSYPSQIGEKMFPMGKFERVTNPDRNILDDYIMRGYACLFEIELTKVHLKYKRYCDPYIPVGKCLNNQDGICINDNGRVLESEKVIICLTDIDMEIIDDIYEYDKSVKINRLYVSKYGRLPKELIDVFCKHYKVKTQLKNVLGYEAQYDMSKRKFNGGFGCMVQNPLNDECVYNSETHTCVYKDGSIKKALSRYRKNAYLSYMWGVWTTAHARRDLHSGIELIGSDNVVYWDTDGIFHLNGAPELFNVYNNIKIKAAEMCGLFAKDKHGVMHHAGTYERDGERILKFKTYGAKKYVCVYENDGTVITISGVNKKDGSKELDSIGGIEAWNLNTVFKDSAGSEFIYNDNVQIRYITEDDKMVLITDNVYSKKSTYSMSITAEYSDVLRNCRTIKRIYDQTHKIVDLVE